MGLQHIISTASQKYISFTNTMHRIQFGVLLALLNKIFTSATAKSKGKNTLSLH